MDVTEFDYLEFAKIREGARLTIERVLPSSSEFPGLCFPMIHDLRLTQTELKSLGLFESSVPAEIDLILLDFPTAICTHQAMWNSLLLDIDLNLNDEIYGNIANSIFPEISLTESRSSGILVNGQLTRDPQYLPRNVFLQKYIAGMKDNKKILIIIGHSDYGGENIDKCIGSYDGRNNDHPFQLLNNIDLAPYSIVIDATCSDIHYRPSSKILPNSVPIFSSASSVIFQGGEPNELQSQSTLLENGKFTVFNWRNVLTQRRQAGVLRAVNL